MNFKRAFNRLRIGDKLTTWGDISLHYLHPYSFNVPAYAIQRRGKYELLTWDADEGSRIEVIDWFEKHLPLYLDKEWEHEISGSDISIWNDPIKHLIIPTGWSWIFDKSPFTDSPRRLCVQQKTRSHWLGTLQTGEPDRVWYTHHSRKANKKIDHVLHRVGGICSIRNRTRGQDLGFVRLDAIELKRVGLLNEEDAHIAGFKNLACFMQVWAQTNTHKITNPVFVYHITGISSRKVEEDHVPEIKESASQIPMTLVMQSDRLFMQLFA